MPIESVIVAPGRGTVVTGKVEKGCLKVGDNLEISTPKKKLETSCMGIEMYHKILDVAQVGDNIGVLLKNIPNKAVKKGDILAQIGVVKSYKSFKAHVYILDTKEGGRRTPFRSGYRPQFFFRVSNVSGSIVLDEGVELVMPGDNLVVSVNLDKSLVIDIGLRFVIREGKLTIGAGVITEILN
jgi:elongation factor Tu